MTAMSHPYFQVSQVSYINVLPHTPKGGVSQESRVLVPGCKTFFSAVRLGANCDTPDVSVLGSYVWIIVSALTQAVIYSGLSFTVLHAH